MGLFWISHKLNVGLSSSNGYYSLQKKCAWQNVFPHLVEHRLSVQIKVTFRTLGIHLQTVITTG